jgi:hypothetical protein
VFDYLDERHQERKQFLREKQKKEQISLQVVRTHPRAENMNKTAKNGYV